MTETRKTLTMGGAALLLVLLALLTAPRSVRPDAFLDQGQPFFPEFTDPNEAVALEVIDFNEDTASARPFKVLFDGTRWSIPSHHDYPADGKDRLAKTAAGVIGLKKDGIRSNNVADHEACGVGDPLDETTTSLKGRGQRVTIKGPNDKVLADLIIGKKVEDRSGYNFVRVPGQKRVYVAKLDLDLSTRFEDWIERDLMQIDKDKIQRIRLRDYSINELTGMIDDRDVVELRKLDGKWTLNRMPSGREIDTTKVDDLLRAIDELNIVGVRTKPAGLTESLRRSGEGRPISQQDLLSLQSRGYYFTRNGDLVSNEGELEVETSEGVTYTLRFGEVVYGSGETVTAGGEGETEGNGPGENRYLFITTSFDPKLLPTAPPRPADTSFEGKPDEELTDADKRNKEMAQKYSEWQKTVESGQEKSTNLNDRFAAWYYVISDASFNKVRINRSGLVKEKSGS